MDFKFVYGPVASWRIGSSLGVDLLSGKEKICSFNCIYCQLGTTKVLTKTRKLYVNADEVIKELDTLPDAISIDYLTLSGRGEPTLAINLGEVIKKLKRRGPERVAVITNSSLIDRQDVRQDLSFADLVIAKLDICSQDSLMRINRPAPDLAFENIIEGLQIFRKGYHGKIALQVMFVESNIRHACAISEVVREISPDEVQLNTPLRRCAVEPLGKEELSRIKNIFGA
ncbi:MAG TPA: radical SAM protein, partial [Syntrophorhabdaceae bacterium]|nr:radical SAM protein [Syntrophorhabdaceae bacterium]